MYLSDFKLGEIVLNLNDSTIFSETKINEIKFIDFYLFTKEYLRDNFTTVYSTNKLIIKNLKKNYVYTFFTNKIVLKEIRRNRNIISTISSSGYLYTISSFVAAFVQKLLAENKLYSIFVGNKIKQAKFYKQDNNYFCSTSDKKIIISFKYQIIDKYNIPADVKLLRLKLFGINWKNFELKLLEYKINK